eukprot:3433260-Pleurochrysis_carterae.AAC.1
MHEGPCVADPCMGRRSSRRMAGRGMVREVDAELGTPEKTKRRMPRHSEHIGNMQINLWGRAIRCAV